MNAESQVDFLRRIQRLLDEGEFVATYKFALLQALADLSVEESPDPEGRLRLPVRRIAEKFIEYYWGHAVPFQPQLGPDGVLMQNTGRQAAVLSVLDGLRTSAGSKLALARTKGALWQGAVSSVAATIQQQPLWKLQTVAGQPDEFLYRKAEYAGGTITLLPGIAEHFRSFHGLVVRLIQGRWAEKVRTMQANSQIIGPTADLESFLFGSERKGLATYRELLWEIDGKDCFYCGGLMKTVPDVDHFVPWSRYPLDLGHNFVLAHPTCNSSKSDLLAHPDHLRRWVKRNREKEGALTAGFLSAGVPSDLQRTLAVARWAYGQGEVLGAHVWGSKRHVALLDDQWRQWLAV